MIPPTSSVRLAGWTRGAAALAAFVPAIARAAPPPAPDLKQEYTAPIEPKDDLDDEPTGLRPRLSIAATFALTDTNDVVGQPDGTSVTFGLKSEAGVDHSTKKNEVRNTLAWSTNFSRTPLVDAWVKTQDAIRLESVYFHKILPYFGPFVRVVAESSVFPGRDARPEPTTYVVAYPDGRTETIVRERLYLTDALTPTTFKESIGPFARLLRTKRRTLEFLAGAGARQVVADGQLAVSDDAGTPEVEVRALQNYAQLGGEAVVALFGELSAGLTYRFQGEAMIPFAHSELDRGDDRSALELTNLEASAKASVRLLSWASVDLEWKALRQPQLVDAVQVQSSLLFTVGLVLPKPEEACECAK